MPAAASLRNARDSCVVFDMPIVHITMRPWLEPRLQVRRGRRVLSVGVEAALFAVVGALAEFRQRDQAGGFPGRMRLGITVRMLPGRILLVASFDEALGVIPVVLRDLSMSGQLGPDPGESLIFGLAGGLTGDDQRQKEDRHATPVSVLFLLFYHRLT